MFSDRSRSISFSIHCFSVSLNLATEEEEKKNLIEEIGVWKEFSSVEDFYLLN